MATIQETALNKLIEEFSEESLYNFLKNKINSLTEESDKVRMPTAQHSTAQHSTAQLILRLAIP